MKMYGIVFEIVCICNVELYFLYVVVFYVLGVIVLVIYLERKFLDLVYWGFFLK